MRRSATRTSFKESAQKAQKTEIATVLDQTVLDLCYPEREMAMRTSIQC